MSLHADELAIDESLVARLVGEQVPEHRGLRLRRLDASGSTNALFRLGEELVVRLPRRPGGSATVLKEARWLAHLQAALPVAVPEVVAVGRPAYGYEEHWSVVRWIDGETATAAALSPEAFARDLADVVCALRDAGLPAEARADPALRWYRGDSLADFDPAFRGFLAGCRDVPGLDLDLDAVLAVWDEAVVAAGPRPRAAHWFHGDLFGENLLVRNGRLAAVLDFGGLGVGDPSVDLAVAWEVLDPAARDLFRRWTGADDRTWVTGRGWALAVAVMTFPYYWHTMPARCASRLVVARQVLDDAGQD